MNDTKEDKHTGQHLDKVCERCLEFARNWSFAAGEYNTLHKIQQDILEQSGKEFAKQNDQIASELRKLAHSFDDRLKRAQSRLDLYIKEGNKNGHR